MKFQKIIWGQIDGNVLDRIIWVVIRELLLFLEM